MLCPIKMTDTVDYNDDFSTDGSSTKDHSGLTRSISRAVIRLWTSAVSVADANSTCDCSDNAERAENSSPKSNV